MTPARNLSRRAFVSAVSGAALAALSGCSLLPSFSSGAAAGSVSLATVTDTAAEVRSATLMMVGDVLVHKGVWESGEQSDGSYSFDHLYAHMADEFAEADIAIVNQETILGGTEMGLSGYPMFCSPQEIGDAEAAAGVNVAAAATNHALDKGFSGIQAELEFWREEHPEVACIGIADSEELAETITYFTCDGLKIALLNYTEATNGISIPSSAPYCVRMLDEDTVTADVEAARTDGADFVVVLPHWGTEYVTSPTSAQEDWAAFFLELGVDVVIGTHPHVLQPVEVLERNDGHQMLVFWSLGNYVSTQADKECMVGGMAHVTFKKEHGEYGIAEYVLAPTVTHRASGTDFGTYLLSDYTEELAASNLIRYSDGCSDFTREWCVDFCTELLGDAFDADGCVLAGSV